MPLGGNPVQVIAGKVSSITGLVALLTPAQPVPFIGVLRWRPLLPLEPQVSGSERKVFSFYNSIRARLNISRFGPGDSSTLLKVAFLKLTRKR
jgi:hypothetical protein